MKKLLKLGRDLMSRCYVPDDTSVWDSSEHVRTLEVETMWSQLLFSSNYKEHHSGKKKYKSMPWIVKSFRLCRMLETCWRDQERQKLVSCLIHAQVKTYPAFFEKPSTATLMLGSNGWHLSCVWANSGKAHRMIDKTINSRITCASDLGTWKRKLNCHC